MEEKNKKSISIPIIIPILIIVIIIMGYFMYKKYVDNNQSKDNENITNTTNTSSNYTSNETVTHKISNQTSNGNVTSNKTSNENTTNSQTSSNGETNNQTSNNTNSSENVVNVTGKWNTFRVYNTSTGVTTENLAEVFGTSYIENGSYLQLNKDGSFVNCIMPVSNGETSTEGTFYTKRNYYKNGDTVVFLNYTDGRQEEYRVIYEDDENTPILYNFTAYNSMQCDLKK